MNFLSLLAFLTVVHAQYFSEGWKPGQVVHTETATAPQPEFTPGVTTTDPGVKPPSVPGGFFERLLVSGPFADLFSKLGINITERIENATASPWDSSVPLVTDDNYGELIMNESMTEEEEKNRVWFLVVSATAAKQNDLNKRTDEIFDASYRLTQAKGDLPHVRWGRIDYLNVTYLTTKWALWQPPYIVVLTDRGQTLRFYKAQHLRLKEENMREFLEVEAWKDTVPWKSMYSPGGEREWVLDYLAYALTKIYNLMVHVPKWILLAISGGVASLALNLMHRSSAPKTKQTTVKKSPVVEGVTSNSTSEIPTSSANSNGAGTTATAQTGANPSKKPARTRKNKK